MFPLCFVSLDRWWSSRTESEKLNGVWPLSHLSIGRLRQRKPPLEPRSCGEGRKKIRYDELHTSACVRFTCWTGVFFAIYFYFHDPFQIDLHFRFCFFQIPCILPEHANELIVSFRKIIRGNEETIDYRDDDIFCWLAKWFSGTTLKIKNLRWS